MRRGVTREPTTETVPGDDDAIWIDEGRDFGARIAEPRDCRAAILDTVAETEFSGAAP